MLEGADYTERNDGKAFQCLGNDIPSDTTEWSCPPNSHHRGGRSCQRSCVNVNKPLMACTLNIVYGCFCDKGYILKHSVRPTGPVNCVPPTECDVTCPPHMHYEPYATGCQPTCSEPEVQAPCTLENQPRCVCDEGYMLSDNYSNCVPLTECGK
ncbi:zonadhesin-like isoform 2-T2 [Discoglossus pictus]